MTADTCSFDGCAKSSRSRTEPLCEGHYGQRYRGITLRPLKVRRYVDPFCDIEGCQKPRVGRYCPMHSARISRHGDPHKVIPHSERNNPRGSANSRWNDDPGYFTVHQRLVRQEGPARDLICSCGSPARQWSYIGPRQPNERMPFSEDLTQYRPRCVSCHKKADAAQYKEDERWRTAKRSRPDMVKSHCPQGHPYDAESTIVWRGKRSCRTCYLASQRHQRQRRRAAVAESDRQASA